MQGTLWVLIYLAAVAVTLVPAHLLELRYFTPAILMAILHAPPLMAQAPAPAHAAAGADDRGRVSAGRGVDLGTTKTASGAGWGVFWERAAWWASIAVSVWVNVVTVLVFLGRTFKDDKGNKARFMY